jgi:hypothetical protein
LVNQLPHLVFFDSSYGDSKVADLAKKVKLCGREGDAVRIEVTLKNGIRYCAERNGGYIFSSDHSVPDSVSLEDFRGIVELAKKLGSYE